MTKYIFLIYLVFIHDYRLTASKILDFFSDKSNGSIFCNLVQQAPLTQACQVTAALLHWSVLRKTAICMRYSKRVWARKGKPYFYVEAKGFSCITPQAKSAP